MWPMRDVWIEVRTYLFLFQSHRPSGIFVGARRSQPVWMDLLFIIAVARQHHPYP